MTEGGEASRQGVLDQLLLIVELLNRDMAVELSARGLTQSRTHVLWELARAPDATQSELARAVGVTPRTMTGLIDGLVESGFVHRQPHPTDRRASVIVLTDKGVEATNWLISSHQELATTLFEGISDAQFTTFSTVLSQVADRLQQAMEAHGTVSRPAGQDTNGPDDG